MTERPRLTDEQLRQMCAGYSEWHRVSRAATELLAIRAEGSAERAHLNVVLASALKVADDRYDHIAKLEAALAEALKAKPWLRNRVQALIAQPAESGATVCPECAGSGFDLNSGHNTATTRCLTCLGSGRLDRKFHTPPSIAGAKP